MIILLLLFTLSLAISNYSFHSIANTDNCTALYTSLNMTNYNNSVIVSIALNATYCDQDPRYRSWIIGTCYTNYTNNYNLINCFS